MPEKFKPLNINKIKTSTNCGDIHYFDSINSTNSWLLENGKCGDICISETQTSGRGRRGNTWESPHGNISFSLCYCFNEITEHWSLLGLITGIAIAEALEDIGLKEHGVKWPNDIYWKQKKLGGILLETSDQSGKVVIGIGLNISLPLKTHEKIEQAVTCLTEAMTTTNNTFSKELLFTHLIKRLHAKFSAFDHFDIDHFIQSWKAWDILNGKHVTFEHQGTMIFGEVIKIDKHGRLGILKQSGELCFYTSADIKLAKKGNSE
ncbi:MAG: biotin--[acetyl-CoA-carboxylase] ligase [Thiotrichaceae bacterium]|nr:biotin--[acetyl-CoA-carboxylase] ligase [Thiotrichaceae bacterium]